MTTFAEPPGGALTRSAEPLTLIPRLASSVAGRGDLNGDLFWSPWNLDLISYPPHLTLIPLRDLPATHLNEPNTHK